MELSLSLGCSLCFFWKLEDTQTRTHSLYCVSSRAVLGASTWPSRFVHSVRLHRRSWLTFVPTSAKRHKQAVQDHQRRARDAVNQATLGSRLAPTCHRCRRSLAVPSLADSSEAIDGHTLRFLIKQNLALKKKEEDEEESGEKEEEDVERRMLELSCKVDALLLVLCFCWEEEEEEEEETSSNFLSSGHAALGCLRQGYWFSLRVTVMLVRRLRQASSPGLGGSSGGDSRLCVRDCRKMERPLVVSRSTGTQKSSSFRVSGCQSIPCPLHL